MLPAHAVHSRVTVPILCLEKNYLLFRTREPFTIFELCLKIVLKFLIKKKVKGNLKIYIFWWYSLCTPIQLRMVSDNYKMDVENELL